MLTNNFFILGGWVIGQTKLSVICSGGGRGRGRGRRRTLTKAATKDDEEFRNILKPFFTVADTLSDILHSGRTFLSLSRNRA